MKPSHKRELWLIILLFVVFTALFAVSIINLNRGLPVFGLPSISYVIEDYVIAILSFLSIIRIFVLIIKH
jgi:hypothetical protein